MNEGHEIVQLFAMVLEIMRKRRVESLAPSLDSLVKCNWRANTFGLRRQKIVVCSEMPFTKNSDHMETSQLICFANRLTGFYMIEVFTKRYFRTDINRKFLVILLSKIYLWQWLNMPWIWLHSTKRSITKLKSDWANKKTW